MSEPVFLLQIVHAQTGAVAQLPAGGPLERDLRDALKTALQRRRITPPIWSALKTAVQRRGVGLFRTEAHVLADLEAALAEVIGTVGHDAHLLADLDAALNEVIGGLKKETRALA